MRYVLTPAIILLLASTALGQEKQTPNPKTDIVVEQQIELPILHRSPPQIGLRRALKFAESKMKQQKINVSQYYLVEAKYTLINFEGKSLPCWRLLWVQEDNQQSVGYELEAYVFMNGRVWLPPVM
jgi:hypothetical protein